MIVIIFLYHHTCYPKNTYSCLGISICHVCVQEWHVKLIMMFCVLHFSFPLCAPLYVFCILHSNHFHSTCALQSLLHYSLFFVWFPDICFTFFWYLFYVPFVQGDNVYIKFLTMVFCTLHFSFPIYVCLYSCFVLFISTFVFIFKLCNVICKFYCYFFNYFYVVCCFKCLVSIVDLLFLLDYFVPLQVHLFLFTFVQLLLDFDVVELQLVFTFIFWLFNSIAFPFCQVIALVLTSLFFTLNHLDNM